MESIYQLRSNSEESESRPTPGELASIYSGLNMPVSWYPREDAAPAMPAAPTATQAKPESGVRKTYQCIYCVDLTIKSTGDLTRHLAEVHNIYQAPCDYEVCQARDSAGNVCNGLLRIEETVAPKRKAEREAEKKAKGNAVAIRSVQKGKVTKPRSGSHKHAFTAEDKKLRRHQPVNNKEMAHAFPGMARWAALAKRFPDDLGDPTLSCDGHCEGNKKAPEYLRKLMRHQTGCSKDAGLGPAVPQLQQDPQQQFPSTPDFGHQAFKAQLRFAAAPSQWQNKPKSQKKMFSGEESGLIMADPNIDPGLVSASSLSKSLTTTMPPYDMLAYQDGSAFERQNFPQGAHPTTFMMGDPYIGPSSDNVASNSLSMNSTAAMPLRATSAYQGGSIPVGQDSTMRSPASSLPCSHPSSANVGPDLLSTDLTTAMPPNVIPAYQGESAPVTCRTTLHRMTSHSWTLATFPFTMSSGISNGL